MLRRNSTHLGLWIKSWTMQYAGNNRQATKTKRNMHTEQVERHIAPQTSPITMIIWFKDREPLLSWTTFI